MITRLARYFSSKNSDLMSLFQKFQLDKSISKLNIEDGKVEVLMNLDENYRKNRAAVQNLLKSVDWVKDVKIALAPTPTQAKEKDLKHLRDVKNVIAVSSCKGGVGKSTVAVNLAFSIAKLGYKVGIYDADIYGPSLPTLIGTQVQYLESPQEDPKSILPVMYEGVKCMSYGYAGQNKKAVFRGPIVSALTQQLIFSTIWGDLDYLVIDTPPGTGDIQLTICQEIPLSSAVIVTTPQKLSFVDVVKGIEMFDELKVPTVAVVENMGYFMCGSCNSKHRPFGMGYLNQLVNQFGIKNSFELPIHGDIARYSDAGAPVVLVHPESSNLVSTFKSIATAVISETNAVKVKSKPKVQYSATESKVYLYKEDKTYSISARELRLKCQCAACVDEFSGHNILRPESVPEDVYPTRIEEKGNYAVAVVWSDGHRSSVYPYTTLLSYSQLA